MSLLSPPPLVPDSARSYMTDRQKIKDGDVIAFAGHTFTDDVIVRKKVAQHQFD